MSTVEVQESEKAPAAEFEAAKEAEDDASSSSTAGSGDAAAKKHFCGLCFVHPKWLQVLVNANVFVVLMFLLAFLQSAIVSGFTSVILSSIETRYNFSSLLAGLVAVTYDITVTLCVAFVSYFGSKSHKPRWIGIGCIIIGVGCIVFALPEFVFGEYEVGDASKGSRYPVCLEDDYEPDCSGSNTGAYALFILGNVLIGIGASPIYLLGITFVDEISHPKRTPIYLALVFLASVVGPSLGYGLGGVFLSIYVDPWVETDLDETDPGWVGAWWIAFVMMGILSLLLSIPFLMFPRQLPNHKIIEKARSEEMANKRRYDPTSRSTVKSSLKTFLIQIKNLFINPSFVFHTLYIAMASFAGFGLLAFFPHYIESQFHLKASTASLLAGAVAIVCSALGILVGGFIVACVKGKHRGRASAIITVIVGILLLPFGLGFLLGCPPPGVYGATVPVYPNTTIYGVDVANCSKMCNCSSTVYEPVCGVNGLAYFSPCRAGCTKKNVTANGDFVFGDCTCIAETLSYTLDLPVEFVLANSTATENVCDNTCSTLPFFMLVLGFGIFVIFLRYIAGVTVTIRCVADEERDLALGLQGIFVRVLGTIPGPIIFGLVFDYSCLYPQNECGRFGNCWIYFNEDLRLRSLSHFLGGFGISVIFSIFTWIFYPRESKNKEPEKEDLELTATNPNFGN